MDAEAAAEARRAALRNAADHGGRAQAGAVLARLLGARPELRAEAGRLAGEVAGIVAEVNAMPPERQRAEAGPAPAAAAPARGGRGEGGLPELECAERGAVVTRFPPEPNGYPHIGHAKAALINERYADMYGGKKILRMDDTNPEAERLEYYAAIKVGLEWLGIEYDLVKNTSDDMGMLLEKGAELIASGGAYVCTCKRDDIGKRRREMKECKCRSGGAGQDADRWERMSGRYKPGAAVVRLRGDMSSPNTVMRDPVLFRIIDARHPLLGDAHRVWPSYDFAVAVEDSADGVTHALRSKEYELRDELYGAILDGLGMRRPAVVSFSRLEFEGMPVSKRVLRPLIESGKIPWYDDPRLPTLEGMRRRGITPGAVRKFVASLGLTKADTRAPFGALEALNRGEIDARSIRLFLVRDPRPITVSGLPAASFEVPNHPSSDMGSRTVEAGPELLLDGADAGRAAAGSSLRLMGLGDVRIDGTEGGLAGTYVGDDVSAGHPRVQWVPRAGACGITVLVPGPPFDGERFDEGSLAEVAAVAEPHFLEVGAGEPIQFVRFGYCRKESQRMAVFTHR